jgi:single-stranded-DNA-specific exonuclease
MRVNLINEINPNYTATEQILTNRGIPYDKINAYLNTIDSDINSFFDLNNMEAAVKMLFKHLKSNSRILIQVDSDVDGFTSAALLYNYLRANYPNARIDYQVHDQKRHGLDMVDSIYQNKYDLIIVPDAGSNEYEKHKELKDLNIDCLVLDHHDALYESEFALVVNNQLSERYENKDLSGVGIVWQLCRAMDHFSIEKSNRPADSYLDLVAVGLVADMVDVRSFETRRLIDKGLEIINNPHAKGKNIFLTEIIKKQSYSLGPEVTPTGIAFYIAPLINAVVRVGTHEERIFIFECFLDEIANELLPSTKRGSKPGDTETRVEQGVRVAGNIRNRQKREQEKAAKIFGQHIDQEYLDNNSLIVLDTGGTVVKDLNGLIANQMQAKYKRPALVISEVDGYIEGSARGYESNVMKDFKEYINNSGLAEFAEGHPNAFGVRFTKENFKKFIEFSNKDLDYGNAHKEYDVDFIIDYEDLDSDMILEIAKLEKLWGTGLKEPLIMFKNVIIDRTKKFLMKGNTLKLMAKDIPCIKFRAPDGAFEELAPNEYTNSIVDIVGKPNLNVFNGQTIGQIFIEDYEIVGTKVNF